MPDIDRLEAAHRHSSMHRARIAASKTCGCFYCCETFPPEAIRRWTDDNQKGQGQTALCPRCGIDSVLGSASGYTITSAFLREMKRHWFGD